MPDSNQKSNSPLEALQNLMKKADELKTETEHLVREAKALSEAGLKEAEGIIEIAVTSWKKMVHAGGLFKSKSKKAKVKKAAKKKSAPQKTKAKAKPKAKAKKK